MQWNLKSPGLLETKILLPKKKLKTIDYDGWQTTQSFYKYLSKILGQFAIDRFAHCDDIKCKKV